MKTLLCLFSAGLLLTLVATEPAEAERRKKSERERASNGSYRSHYEPQRRFNPDPSPSAATNTPNDNSATLLNPFDYRARVGR
jgi:hypothetical protein